MLTKCIRTKRVAKEMHKKISFILQRFVKDPRIGIVTISHVTVSRDLSYAKVFVTFLNFREIGKIKIAIRLLQNMSKLIRHLIIKDIKLRLFPKLTFIYDKSLLNGINISRLVEKLNRNNLFK
ncbi:Ribosome-binding factor A [Candidatus Westeberhardia cardiocondylae]|uniref:Ribosome-binding factor A n=1 Tax=Candidatus Westeberhardia cardiocondylae TaxID=1594731 RepID=A0A0H5BWU5_9ENTR|nr:30S ribosome-binding factor RbfA [Candidatus Westeberhardia cardiocondylae]CEN32153.1 Ribosome-binding factor A [Candidatus Westeberhardia cardiocondylae]